MKPIFIFICGNMATGKTTLTNNIIENFPNFNIVNADLIRKYFRENYPFYSNLDESYPTPIPEELRIEVIDPLREKILKLLLKHKQPIILNKSGINKEERKNILKCIPKNYTKLLIQAKVDEEELLERIRKRDKEYIHSKNWEKFYNEIRKGKEEDITKDECKNILIYNQKNLDEILIFIKKII